MKRISKRMRGEDRGKYKTQSMGIAGSEEELDFVCRMLDSRERMSILLKEIYPKCLICCKTVDLTDEDNYIRVKRGVVHIDCDLEIWVDHRSMVDDPKGWVDCRSMVDGPKEQEQEVEIEGQVEEQEAEVEE